MPEGQGGRFRSKKHNFSMVSNAILRDKGISLKAKGLYSLIQSYISIDGYVLYKNFLIQQSKDSHNTFDTAWKELKDNGYLVQYKLRDKNNRYVYEYELLDEPQPKKQGMENTDSTTQFSTHGNSTPWKSGLYNNTLKTNTKKYIKKDSEKPKKQTSQNRISKPKTNAFHNFNQRDTDLDALQELLTSR